MAIDRSSSSQANESPGRIFLRLYRDFQQRCTPKLEALGYGDVTEAHLNVLIHIDSAGTRSVTLAEKASMTKQSMGDLLHDLTERGYLTREADPGDKRASIVRLSERGLRFLVDVETIKSEMIAEYEAVLGREGAQNFFASAMKLLDRT